MKCKLEPLNLTFANDLAYAIGDGRVNCHLRDLPLPYTAENAKDFINYALSADKNIEMIFAITLDGKFIGCISATRQQNVHRYSAEIGYYIAPDHWGKGYATQAIKDICAYVFKNTDIVRLYAEPFARNKASCRVLEKAGFACEGTLRKNAFKHGVWEDMKVYSLLK